MIGLVKFLPVAGLAVGSFAVILQLVLTVQQRVASGHSLPEAIVFFLSFFTILTNGAAVLVYAARLFSGRLALFATPRVRAGVAVAIAMVGLVYATVLAQTWAPEGMFRLCDVLLHYVAPVIYGLWWLAAGRDGSLNWSDAPKMLLFPVLYLAYALARGQLTGLYPYPFIDAATLGLTGALANAAIVALTFLAFSLGAVAIDRRFKFS